MRRFAGKWVGTNKLWFDDPARPLVSDGTATVSEDRLDYSWAYEDRTQTGAIVFRGDVAEWTDTFHATTMMRCAVTRDAKEISTFGKYIGGGDAEWGWRTVIELLEPDHFMMRMYNIEPDGREFIAVEHECRRAD